MKHVHFEKIVAKAANMELVVLAKSLKWHEVDDEDYLFFSQHDDYFLCLPQHKEACLHWLNGGDVQVRDFVTSPFLDITDWGKEWLPNGCGFMVESWVIRIKPKKEKRWIAVNSDGYVMPIHTDSVESAKAHANHDESRLTANVQYIEIEVEV